MKPATPLPWSVEKTAHSNFTRVIRCGAEMNGPNAHQDAAYIVHAANNLPRAIEALKDNLAALHWAETHTQGNVVQFATCIAVTKNLLAELGESDEKR